MANENTVVNVSAGGQTTVSVTTLGGSTVVTETGSEVAVVTNSEGTVEVPVTALESLVQINSVQAVEVNVESQDVEVDVQLGGGSGGGGGGSGDVVGPISSTDNAIVRWNGITGQLIQDSGITIADGASGSLSGTNSGDVTIGTANGLSLAGQAISLGLASTSTTGALSNTDWNTFNNKAASGNYITALTGDGTASGPGSVPLTLATVASAGTTGSSTAIPVITINAKGLTTSITTAAVIAPAVTLTGTTLASNVIASSLTSVSTLTGGATGAGFTIALGTSTITGDLPFANLTQISGLSVLGVTGSSAADVAAITASNDGEVFRRNGASIGFGLISPNALNGNLPINLFNSATGASNTTFWRGDATWAVPPGSGDVIGPATNSANFVPQWNGANSKTLKNGLDTSTGGVGGSDGGKLALFGGIGDLSAFGTVSVFGSTTTGIYGSSTVVWTSSASGKAGTLLPVASALTADREWTMPNATGTVLLDTTQATKAWVNFDGTSAITQAATYSRTLTTVTITLTAHTYITGNIAQIDFTSGGAADGLYTITGITDANNFTVTTAASGTIAAGSTLNLLRNTIRTSSGVHDVVDAGTGIHYVNFSTAMTDANYTSNPSAGNVGAGLIAFWGVTAPTAQACEVRSTSTAFALTDATRFSAIFSR